MVLGLARGGVVVGRALAQALSLPLDVLVVKKIPAPGNAELAVGALAPDGVSVVHWIILQRLGADEDYLKTHIPILTGEIKNRLQLYRKGRKPLEVKGKTVCVVDDGAATGATMEAAVKWLKKKKARKIIVALPVAPPDTVAKIKPEVNEMVVLETPPDLSAVGQFYDSFLQVEDGEVIKILRQLR